MIYAAYGSNLNKMQMGWRCPDAKPVGTAVLEGHRLSFKGSLTGSYLTVEEAEGELVPLGLWEISKKDESMLDRYEGYPMFYKKEYIPVKVNGRKRNALIYIMTAECEYGMPTNEYLASCMIGYQDFGIDTKPLIEAITYTSIKIIKGGNVND